MKKRKIKNEKGKYSVWLTDTEGKYRGWEKERKYFCLCAMKGTAYTPTT